MYTSCGTLGILDHEMFTCHGTLGIFDSKIKTFRGTLGILDLDLWPRYKAAEFGTRSSTHGCRHDISKGGKNIKSGTAYKAITMLIVQSLLAGNSQETAGGGDYQGSHMTAGQIIYVQRCDHRCNQGYMV